MLEAAAEIDARESAASVKQELLRLVVLLREVQPIKRRSVWPIEVILHLDVWSRHLVERVEDEAFWVGNPLFADELVRRKAL